MKKTLFTLVLVSIVALSACATGPEPDVQEDSSAGTETDSVESALDTDTTVTAVRTKNKALCDTLSSKEQVDNCHIKVADAIVLDSAAKGTDMKSCKAIKEEKTMKQCEIMVQENKDQEEEAQNMKEEQDKVNEVVASGDVGGCKNFEQENYRMQCETNIYMKQAADNNDPAPCANIKDEFSKESCLLQVSQ